MTQERDSNLVVLKPALGGDGAQLVDERASSAFRPPQDAPPPSGMASGAQLEAFRELRTRLALMAAGVGLTHFTTLVVPLVAGSGASFVARNLAAAFTLQQRIALLVDCNFRSASQHRALGALDPGGLLDFLNGGVPAPIDALVRPTAIPGLHVIPAGSCGAPQAAGREHFSSLPMKALMARLRAEPCFIVLDGPAVEGSPDARILSDLADLVVIVVAYGRSTARDVARAAALFDARKLAGVVFNDLEPGRRAAPPAGER
jgi:protein-tyrosine kinase